MKLPLRGNHSMRRHEQAQLYLKKALEDEMLLDEVIDSHQVSDEIFGFHCQQAAEKLLKAFLSSLEVRIRKTHDLRELIDLLTDHGHPVPSHLTDVDRLTPYGTLFRYDVLDAASHFNRMEARKLIQELREWVERKIRDA